MAEHTPVPWRRAMAQDGEYTGPGDNPPGYAGDWYATNEIEAGDEAAEFPTRVGYADHPADAEFIVRACNAHADLLAACELLVARWDAFYADDGSVSPFDYLDGHEFEAARAAIAKARGIVPANVDRIETAIPGDGNPA